MNFTRHQLCSKYSSSHWGYRTEENIKCLLWQFLWGSEVTSCQVWTLVLCSIPKHHLIWKESPSTSLPSKFEWNGGSINTYTVTILDFHATMERGPKYCHSRRQSPVYYHTEDNKSFSCTRYWHSSLWWTEELIKKIWFTICSLVLGRR